MNQLQRIMDSYSEKKEASKCFVGSLLTLSMLSSIAAGSLIVLLASRGTTGFMNDTSTAFQNCSSNYLTQKYDNINIINRIIFSASIVATLISLQIGLILLGSICKQRSNTQQQPLSLPSGKLFFFCGCQGLTTIPLLGYYFSIFIEAKNCSCSLDFSQIIIVLGISALLMALTMVMIISIIRNALLKKARQQKYRQVKGQQTEPAEDVRCVINNWRNDLKNAHSSPSKLTKQPRMYINERLPDITNEDILIPQDSNNPDSYQRPLPTRFGNVYDNQRIKKDRLIQDNPNRRSPVNDQERIVNNLHPDLMNIDPLQYVQIQKKKKQQFQVDLPNEFYKEQQKYLQNANQPILPRGGLQERNNYHNESFTRDQYQKGNHNNYANINNHPNERGRYYSPNRNQNNRHNMRQYSTNNQQSYPVQLFRDQKGHPIIQEGMKPFIGAFNSRSSDYQEQSFRFYQDNRPRRMNQYR